MEMTANRLRCSATSRQKKLPRDRSLRTRLKMRLQNLKRAYSNMGVINTLLYIYKAKLLNIIYSRKRKIEKSYIIDTLRTKQLMYPVFFRYNSSDINAFSQIFVSDEYSSIDILNNINFIIDCGANAGYSSAYFLSKFPEAHIIAVEPDRRNYEILKRNLSVYGDRVTTVCSAIWSHKVGLKVHMSELGEWSTSVSECLEGEEADLEAMDIATLISRSKYDKIDILKIDIEGAESIVFSRNFEGWINKVSTFVIELHGKECKEIFYRALNPSSFSFGCSGELTIAQRR